MKPFRLLLAIVMIAWVGQTYAQNALVPTFKASKKANTDRLQANDLARSFEQYTLLQIDHQAIFQFARQQKDFTHFQLDLGDLKMDLPLEINSLRKADCSLVLGSNPDKKMDVDIPVYTYKGRADLGLDRQIRMTIHPDYISAFLLIDGEEYYLEPANRFAGGNNGGDYVWYNQKWVINNSATCATDNSGARKPLAQEIQARSTCIETDVAIAADYSYYTDHGSDNGQVMTDLEEIFNIVDGIYQTDLNVDLQIITYFISDCSTCDPWTTSTNSSTLLSDFKNWGNAGGFLTSVHDVASFWTNRDFEGSVVGRAYLDAVCGSLRYNVNQDYTSNLGSLKTLWAHELGHNFGSHHDNLIGCTSGYIMWPSVISSANSFSSCSISEINGYLSGVSCLATCNSCPGREEVSTTLSGTTKIEVDHEILADNDVLSTADVIYDAGYEVILLPDFDAQAGCDFLAVIDGCGGSYKTGGDAPRIILQEQNLETIEAITELKCYPNPFSESTTLSYTLANDQNISLSIFNPNGQEIVRLLENVTQIAGSHEVTFDGNHLPKGLYFYRFIDGGGNVLTGKMSKF